MRTRGHAAVLPLLGSRPQLLLVLLGVLFLVQLAHANMYPQGPQISEVFETAKTDVIIIWILCATCSILAVARYWLHRREIRRMPYSTRRTLFLRMIRTGPIAVGTTFASLFFVREAALFEVARSIQEAIVIHYFALLVLEFHGGKAECMARLSKLPPAKYLNVPPFCWMCKPCCAPRHFTRNVLEWALMLAEQFVYVVPSIAVLQLWFALEQAQDAIPVLELLSLILDILKVVSITFAMYGLFILFLAVRPAIQAYRPGLKLLAIKLIVIINAVQSIIVGAAVTKANGKTTDGNIFAQDYKQVFWRNWLLNVEALPLVFLLARAYPASELLLPTLRSVDDTMDKSGAAESDAGVDGSNETALGAGATTAVAVRETIPMRRPTDPHVAGAVSPSQTHSVVRQPSPLQGSSASTPLLIGHSSV